MTSNQTPKYQIGQEVYVIGDGAIHKTKITNVSKRGDYYCYNVEIYRIQSEVCYEDSIYATKEDIIKDLH